MAFMIGDLSTKELTTETLRGSKNGVQNMTIEASFPANMMVDEWRLTLTAMTYTTCMIADRCNTSTAMRFQTLAIICCQILLCQELRSFLSASEQILERSRTAPSTTCGTCASPRT